MNNRYNNFSDYSKKVFGKRLIKLGIDAGFTCPNRDGTVGVGGCIFCGSGASDFNVRHKESITEQMKHQIANVKPQWRDSVYCAYFQSYTNTYGEVDYLKSAYEEAISIDGVVALAIATRPDCLSDKILDLLSYYNEKTFLWIELGLQTIYDSTAEYINRGYMLSTYEEAVKKLKKRNLRYMTHIIFGLPYESKEMMLETVKFVAKEKPFGIKIHSLFMERDTEIHKRYTKNEFKLLSLEEYVGLVVESISLLPKETLIARITGDGNKEKLVAPLWSADKLKVISKINYELKNRDITQGDKSFLL